MTFIQILLTAMLLAATLAGLGAKTESPVFRAVITASGVLS